MIWGAGERGDKHFQNGAGKLVSCNLMKIICIDQTGLWFELNVFPLVVIEERGGK